jgi:outer membrane lipoprotein-sorting protein
MTSSGTVLAKGSAMLWNTTDPSPSIMRVDEKELSLYYPEQKTLEIYALGSEVGSLAASPVPRLAVLLQHFRFAYAPKDEFPEDPTLDSLALRLTPLDQALSQHVQRVTVLIDIQRGFMLACELIDADGEKTLIRFSDVKVNAGVDDARLRLDVPADAKRVHPLEDMPQSPAVSTTKP